MQWKKETGKHISRQCIENKQAANIYTAKMFHLTCSQGNKNATFEHYFIPIRLVNFFRSDNVKDF